MMRPEERDTDMGELMGSTRSGGVPLRRCTSYEGGPRARNLNRSIKWAREGVAYESDRRHAER